MLSGQARHRRISDATFSRVRQAAEELNYAPNLLTRSLRRGRTHVLSFYSGFRRREDADNYMDQLSAGMEKAGGAFGYDILIHCNFNRSPKEVYQFLNGGLADGLILFAAWNDDPLLPLLRKSSLPVVLLSSRDSAGVFPSVCDDQVHGMRMIADQLLKHGHRRIAVVESDDPNDRDAAIRVKLLRKFLSEDGVEIPQELIVNCSDSAGEVMRLMALRNPPTAVFCWHDRVAYTVLSALESLGDWIVPHRLSVIGYDGIQWPSATRHVAASLKVDLDALARSAVNLLDQYIDGYIGPVIELSQAGEFLPGTTLSAAPQLK